MSRMLRTHTCGELTEQEAEKTVTLCGWVDTFRQTGKIGFLLLRDRAGITQIFLDKTLAEQYQHELKKESVVLVEGIVNKRPVNQVKKELKTGSIEVAAKKLSLSASQKPLFQLMLFPKQRRILTSD